MGRFLSIDSWTGDFLAERGLVTPQQLNEASELAVRWGANLADVMLTKNWIAEDEYYTALAERFSVELVDLQRDPLDRDLLEEADVATYARTGRSVARRERRHYRCHAPGPETYRYARRKWGRVKSASPKKDIQRAVQVFSSAISMRLYSISPVTIH